MSAASSASSHSPVVRSASREARVGINAARFVTRSPFVAKPGSSARAGRPSARQKRGHCRSLPTATAIAPSAVSNASYGTMFGWALPSRPGDVAGERVLGLVDERGEGRAEERQVDPLAGRRRRALALGVALASAGEQRGETATAPFRPVRTSLIATPTFVGRPPPSSGAPVIDIRPARAWITKS